MSLRTLIVAAPRTGTTFIANVLQAVGLDIPHERHGTDGAVGWEYAVDCNRTAWGGQRSDGAFVRVWHQTREPLPTIASLQTTHGYTWDWIGRHIALPADLLSRCMTTYVEWNALCERMTRDHYRVEDVRDGSETWRQICRWLGLPEDTLCPPIPTNTNTREHAPVTWVDLRNTDPLLADRVRQTAARYGYSREG